MSNDNMYELIDAKNEKIFELNTIILEQNNKIRKLEVQNGVLWGVIKDIMYMAIRYAHGRHTYAPSIIREDVKLLKQIRSDFKLKYDDVIQPPKEDEIKTPAIREDWLDDLFEEVKK